MNAEIKNLNPYYSPFLYRWGQRITRSFFHLATGYDVRGLDHIPMERMPIIFAANHRSLMDPPLLGCIIPRPIFYFAKEELFNVPFVGWYIRRVNSFPVRRSAHDVGALKTSLAVLNAGYPLLLFPEGGRRLEPHTQWKARAGVGMLAAKTGATVIPVGIVNSENVTHFAKVYVRFGKPMPPPADTGGETYQRFADDVMSRIQELCHE